jgi:hypothetical protein
LTIVMGTILSGENSASNIFALCLYKTDETNDIRVT